MGRWTIRVCDVDRLPPAFFRHAIPKMPKRYPLCENVLASAIRIRLCMKIISTLCLLALNIALAGRASGQSSFSFRNFEPGLVDAPIFDPQGAPVTAPNYLGELWGGATSNSLAPLRDFYNGNRQILAPYSPGYFISSSASLCVLSVHPYGWAWLQVRAWDARLGGAYEQVVALGVGGYGESNLLYLQGGNPWVLMAPPPLIGLQSFSLRPVVPEPNTGAFLLLGAPLLLWLCRRPK